MTVTDNIPAAEGSWELPQELQMLQEVARDFIRREVIPVEANLDPDAYALPPEILSEVQAKARSLGLWMLASPAKYGGAELSMLAQSVVAEEAGKCRMGPYTPAGAAFGWDPPNVIFGGTEEQIQKFAVPIIENAGKTFVAISEPQGGADPARSIKTTARRVGDKYVINGQKMWISSADSSEWGLVYARTDTKSGRSGISSFIVEKDTPGMELRKIPVIRAWSPTEVFFTDCEIPAENLLGKEGEGFKLAQQWLTFGRIVYAAGAIGTAQAALAMAVDYAKQRKAFGGTLADKQAIQWMLADSEIELRAARLLTYQAAWKADRGEHFKTDASIAKVYATEAAGRVIDRAVQIFGGMGVAKELPLERWYRELRIKRIGEGPSEVHRMVVARELLRGAA